MDEEVSLALYVLPLHDDPPVPLEFQVPPVPQAEPFSPMSPKAFQAFTTYWYDQALAKAYAQAQPK